MLYYHTESAKKYQFEARRPTSQDRRDEIIHYVTEHPGATRTDVINHLNDIKMSSRDTTIDVINELLRDETLIIDKNRSNRQTHYLLINDEDEFNRISMFISKLENLFSKNEIQEILNILQDEEIEAKQNSDKLKTEESEERGFYFIETYQSGLIKLIYWLIAKIGSSKIPEEKSRVLYLRIIELMRVKTQALDQMHIEVEIQKFQASIDEFSKDKDEFTVWSTKILTKVKSALEELQNWEQSHPSPTNF